MKKSLEGRKAEKKKNPNCIIPKKTAKGTLKSTREELKESSCLNKLNSYKVNFYYHFITLWGLRSNCGCTIFFNCGIKNSCV